jgi:hypothetical protein
MKWQCTTYEFNSKANILKVWFRKSPCNEVAMLTFELLSQSVLSEEEIRECVRDMMEMDGDV